jgi:hypothetical protein
VDVDVDVIALVDVTEPADDHVHDSRVVEFLGLRGEP